MCVYQFLAASVTKYPKLGGIIQQKHIFLQFWRLKSKNEGVSRAIIFMKALRDNPFLSALASGVCRQSLKFLGF